MLRDRGVSFEEYDEPDLKTKNGVFADETGFRAAWFKDPDGHILALFELEDFCPGEAVERFRDRGSDRTSPRKSKG